MGREERGDIMKLRKAKRFNTVESYAACICLYASCSCGCNCGCGGELGNSRSYGEADIRADSVFDTNYYSYNNISG